MAEESSQLSQYSDGFGGSENGRCSDEVACSSLSEGEDSMYGYDSNDEHPADLLRRRFTRYSLESKGNDENSLLMTSSIAFGSNDWDDFMEETTRGPPVPLILDELRGVNSTSATTTEFPSIDTREKQEQREDITILKVQGTDGLAMCSKPFSSSPTNSLIFDEKLGKIVKDIYATSKELTGVNLLNSEHVRIEADALASGLNTKDCLWDVVEHESASNKETIGMDSSPVSLNHPCSATVEGTEGGVAERIKDKESSSLLSLSRIAMKITGKDDSTPFSLLRGVSMSSKMANHESNEIFEEVVHEMEEILFDSGESPAAWFNQGNRMYHSMVPVPRRDGGSTASTSGIDDAYSVQHHLKIDGVEVIGARQKRGEVSLSERLVGVKEYTIYRIQVWSGVNNWEVERRYRDFYILFCRLKTVFANQGLTLPSPWSSVEQKSKSIFGSVSPDTISERSVLIQECLQSIIHSSISFASPSALVWFLSPPKNDQVSLTLDNAHMSSSSYKVKDSVASYNVGQTISLIVEIRPNKSMKQILEEQHYTCAGCHKHFDDGKTRVWEFMQKLGWGKPRLCEYSGQLFCSSCHVNETAVLPARVLHLWDFSEYLVSRLAKSYLDSIHEQPMLCVSAVNPFLLPKVAALQHVTNVRKIIGSMLPYLRCPFRRTIFNGLGSRRYIIESNDFFALKDLIDLSKGVFAALPVMLETVSRRILEHITEQCLICCDVGVPCNARQACDDPSSLIFPFQEGEVERCRSCDLVFHKRCFKKIQSCACGAPNKSPSYGNEVGNILNSLGTKSDSKSSIGFLTRLFSTTRERTKSGHEESGTLILMGSLPGTSL